jgi:aspartate/methionine/tyrosine aminotransferase
MAEGLRRVPSVRFALPDGAFYFFVDVPPRLLDGRGAAPAGERKVVTIPGRPSARRGGWLRLSYAASEEAIVEGISRIAQELG